MFRSSGWRSCRWKLALPVFAIIAIVTLLVFLLYNFVAKRTIARILSGFLVIVLTIGYGVGNYYISKTGEVIGDVTRSDQYDDQHSVGRHA
ncbi:MAG: hypothetical protein ACOX1W_01370 [Catenisphaera adipataccumulans]|uniref:hypothetical protein n=1 Tax=Catenisphaera adipataccumulans TaxID=700500 RepID=UPI003D92C59C